MALLVQKYGGTSVCSIENLALVADRIIADRQAGHQVVVVVSAMAGDTDRLAELAQQVTEDPVLREYDMLLSSGEMITIALLSMMLNKKSCPAYSYLGSQVRILTDSIHKKAHVIAVETERLQRDIANSIVPVVAGFQGINEQGELTTLGRGGSDATAVALAAALAADECQIYTDVEGVCSADPRLVNDARVLDRVSYDEMLQMASLGAKVLQPQSVELAYQNDVSLRVGSTFNRSAPGTLLCHHVVRLRAMPVTGVVAKRDLARVTLRSVPHEAGFVARVLGLLASRNITVDMFVQHHNEAEQAALSLVVLRDELMLAQLLLSQLAEEFSLPAVIAGQGVAKLSLVGHGLSSHPQVLNQMFSVLAEHEIDIFMLTSSEIKVSVLVAEELLEIGVEALHNSFQLSYETK